jgi:hypothetical protein
MKTKKPTPKRKAMKSDKPPRSLGAAPLFAHCKHCKNDLLCEDQGMCMMANRNWCAWCAAWGDHTSGSCKELARDSRVAQSEARTIRLLGALKAIAAQNCQSKRGLAEMIAQIRLIAREAIISDDYATEANVPALAQSGGEKTKPKEENS